MAELRRDFQSLIEKKLHSPCLFVVLCGRGRPGSVVNVFQKKNMLMMVSMLNALRYKKGDILVSGVYSIDSLLPAEVALIWYQQLPRLTFSTDASTSQSRCSNCAVTLFEHRIMNNVLN